jgi:broad specificity phosphatase PhoE
MGEIYLIRHGQASWGSDDYDNLSETGIVQSATLGRALKPHVRRVDRVICGTMKRHLQTAEGVMQAMGLPANPSFDAGWNEYDHEDIIHAYEPRYRDRMVMITEITSSENPWKEFNRMFFRAVSRWMGGEHDADYSETWRQFCARVEDGLSRIDKTDPESVTIVFTSGGPISIVARKLLELSDESAMKMNWNLVNTGITRLFTRGASVYLSSLNEHSLLPGQEDGLLTFR